MACEGCNSEDLELCSCEDGKNAFTITTTSVDSTSAFQNGGAGLSFAVSNVGQYTGSWAKKGSTVFLSYTNPSTLVTTTYGYYLVVSSTATTIVLKEHTTPFVGGAAFANNTIDFQQHSSGTITFPSGTFITSGGVKGASGSAGAAGASLIAIDHNQLGANNPTSQTAYSAVQETVTIDSDNRLDAVGDSLRIRAKFFYNYVSGTDTPEVKIEFYQTGPIVIPLITYPLDSKYPGLEVEIILTRSATAGSIDFTTKVNLFTHFGYTYSTEAALGIGGIYYNEGIAQGGTIDFTSDFEIQFSGKVSDPANAIKVGFYSVEFLNKI